MADLGSLLLGAAVLAGALGVGALRWVRPRWSSLDVQGLGLLALLILTLVGGFIGAFLWWADEPNGFSWDLPPLASRMLAAAGWSFAVPAGMALEHPSRRRVRLALLLLATYLLPLVAAILFFHLDRFDFSKSITYGFFLIAGGMSVASVWYLLRQPRIVPEEARDDAPARLVVQAWLGAVALVTGVWGVALFLTDDGPARLIWVWPGDLLTSRLIAVMLLTIAVGCAASRRYADTARVMLGMTIVYGLGVALAGVWNAFKDKPVPEAYVAVFGAIFAGSALLIVLGREEAGITPPVAAAAPRYARCRAVRRADARYCTACGAPAPSMPAGRS